jgi:hypothetical protein
MSYKERLDYLSEFRSVSNYYRTRARDEIETIYEQSKLLEKMLDSLIAVRQIVSARKGPTIAARGSIMQPFYNAINKISGEVSSSLNIYRIVKGRDSMVDAITHSIEEIGKIAIGSPYEDPEEIAYELAKISDKAESLLIRRYDYNEDRLRELLPVDFSRNFPDSEEDDTL